MNKREWETQQEILRDGLQFYRECLDNTMISQSEIKPRTAQYIHDKYNTGVLKAITLSHEVQAMYYNIEEQIKNIPW